MILKRLRAETSIRHAALEERLPLMDPQLSMAVYRGLLERFHGYYAPLEALLLRLPWWNEIDFTYEPRRKTPALERDLAALGETPGTLAPALQCEFLPSLANIPRLLGCLYVIEGATLGGQIITRHLQTCLGLTVETGGAFFSGYGTETGPQWLAFAAMVRNAVARIGGEDDIVASANDTFATLDRWLFPAAEEGAK